jgi:hypothetical protein
MGTVRQEDRETGRHGNRRTARQEDRETGDMKIGGQ